MLRVILVTTLVSLALGDGPGGHHGHHGGHHEAHGHGAHHNEHHAHAPKHPENHAHPAPVHAAHHAAPAAAAHPHPRPHAAAPGPPKPVRPRAVRPPPVRRPIRQQRPILRRPPNPLNPLLLAQRQKALPNVPRLVRGLHNNLPDRPPVARPVPHLRRPNPNLIPQNSGPTKKPVPQVVTGKSVAALIAENEHFSTLHTALKAAGMMERLAAKGPFTIFAPTNAAFDKVPVDSLNKLMADKEELVKVLERHIVPGVRMEGKEVPAGNKKFKSAAGEEIITDRSKFVKVTTPAKSAFVVKFDFLGNNGVFHAVDQVL